MSPPGGAQMVLDTTKMIRPKPRAAMPGTNAWASSSAASTLTACTRRQPARSTAARPAWSKSSCGVHQDVAAPMLAEHVRDRRADLVFPAQVHRRVPGLVEGKHGVTRASQFGHDRAADGARPAGDHGNTLAGLPTHHG